MGVMIPLESFFLVTLQKNKNNDLKRKEQDYMPLRLPDKLPAIELLKHENIFVTFTPGKNLLIPSASRAKAFIHPPPYHRLARTISDYGW